MANILLTGGAGFIGSHLVSHLISTTSHTIYNMDKLEYCSSLVSLKDHPRYHFIKGDITSADFVNFILEKYHITIIIHAAAHSHVDNSFGDSFNFTRNNIFGTHVLLEAARVHQIRKFIHVSTDEVYGQVSMGIKCGEDSVLSPSNPYSATKAAAEHLVYAYYKSFSLPIIVTRSNNIYGPGQFPEKVIPKFVCSLLKQRKCYIHGDGLNSRRYLYISDLVCAIALILEQGVIGETYNIGSDFEISNLDLAHRLCDELQLERNNFCEFVADRPYNDKRYAIDCQKLVKLGWKGPAVHFDDGLKMTSKFYTLSSVEWYKDNMDTYWKADIQNVLVPHPGPLWV